MARSKYESDGSKALVRQLAGHLLTLKAGERIASVRTLASMTHSSVGWLSNALNSLEASGVVTLERRGRMGSFIRESSPGKLWAIAEGGPMVIGLTLPSNLYYEGLATGLKSILLSAGIEVYMVFIRGSRTRLKALRDNRCHIVVMSSFAAEGMCSRRERIILRLPPKTFVTGHHVYYRAVPHERGAALSVAIDRDSYDQERLTEMEFQGTNVKMVPVMFPRIHRLLKDGLVDVAVWTSEDMQSFVGDDILDRPLSEAVSAKVNGKDTSAALVARSDDVAVQAVIRSLVTPDELTTIQQMVVNGEMRPEY